MADKEVYGVREALISAVGAMIVAGVGLSLYAYHFYRLLVVLAVGVVTFLAVLYLKLRMRWFYRHVVWACVGMIALFLAVPGFRAAGFLGEKSAFVVMVDSVGTVGFLGLCGLCAVGMILCAVMEYIQRAGGAEITAKGGEKEKGRVLEAPKVEQEIGSADRSPVVGYAERVEIHYGEEGGAGAEVKEGEAERGSEKKGEGLWPGASAPFGGVKVSTPFAGREEELAELGEAMCGESTVVAVVGMAGQGKSCLAGEWYKRGARPPEGLGLFWRRVYEGGYSFDKFVNDLHDYLTGREINPQAVPTVEGRAALAVAALKGRPCWIVLDGAERWMKRWAAQPDAGAEGATADDRAGQDEVLDKFLKDAGFWDNGSRLVLTTRAVPSALDDNPPVMVGQRHGREKRLADLKEGEAVGLLKELGVEGDEGEMRQAVRAYGCHAYCVHVLGALIVDLYGRDGSRWREVNPLGEPKVAGLFERVIEHRPEDLALLEYVGSSVGPGRVEMLGELLGEDEKAVRRRLAELEKWQMVEFGGVGAEEHTVVRQFMQGRMGEAKVKEVRRGIARWWAEREVALNPTRREEIEPLLRAVEHLLAAGEPLDAMRIFFTKPSEESYYSPGEWLWMFGYLDEHNGMLGEAIRVYEEAIEKEGRRELRNNLATCYNNRGNALQQQGKLGDAIVEYGRAIEIYKGVVEKEGRRELRSDLASCYNNRGVARREQGKLADAIGDCGRAIAIREELVEKEGRRELRNDLAMCYNNRGLALRLQGKLAEAIEDYGRAIEIREELVEKEGRRELRNELAMCYNNRGGALGEQGKLDEAIEDFGRANEIYEELVEKEGRRELRGDLETSLFNRALARSGRGEWEEARADIERGGGLLIELIEEGQRHVLSPFMQTAGFRCRCARELGGTSEAAEWANRAMGWFMEEAAGGRATEVLLRAAAEFADDVAGMREALSEGGLNEELLVRFLRTVRDERKD